MVKRERDRHGRAPQASPGSPASARAKTERRIFLPAVVLVALALAGTVDEQTIGSVPDEQQMAYTRTDARHRVTINGTWNTPGGFRLSPVFRYKSKTPYNVVAGTDLNRDGTNFDLPPGVTELNSARGADFKQFDLRLARFVNLTANKRIEIIAEGFNVTNAKNAGTFIGNKSLATFGTPTTYAGDFQRGEQRLFQLGLRFDF